MKRREVELGSRRELDNPLTSGFNSCFSDAVFVTLLRLLTANKLFKKKKKKKDFQLSILVQLASTCC